MERGVFFLGRVINIQGLLGKHLSSGISHRAAQFGHDPPSGGGFYTPPGKSFQSGQNAGIPASGHGSEGVVHARAQEGGPGHTRVLFPPPGEEGFQSIRPDGNCLGDFLL